jgi:hypothetical protein
VYITLFGPSLSLFTLDCILTPKDAQCEKVKKTLTTLGSIYKQNRIGADSRPVLSLSIDDLVIKGFLVATPLTIQGMGDARTITFKLQILGQVVL